MDSRLQKLAKVLVNYSLGVKSGQLFKISAEPIAAPLVLAVYEEAIKLGANSVIELGLIDIRETLLKFGNDEQLMYLSPMRKLEVEELQSQLSIWATTNTKNLSNVDPKRQQLLSRGSRPYLERFFERVGNKTLHWC
ncbi:Aminopeptidase (fragment) [Candidatus Zixiibacteriota bacterium]